MRFQNAMRLHFGVLKLKGESIAWWWLVRQTEVYDDVPAAHHIRDRGSKDGAATTLDFVLGYLGSGTSRIDATALFSSGYTRQQFRACPTVIKKIDLL